MHASCYILWRYCQSLLCVIMAKLIHLLQHLVLVSKCQKLWQNCKRVTQIGNVNYECTGGENVILNQYLNVSQNNTRHRLTRNYLTRCDLVQQLYDCSILQNYSLNINFVTLKVIQGHQKSSRKRKQFNI